MIPQRAHRSRTDAEAVHQLKTLLQNKGGLLSASIPVAPRLPSRQVRQSRPREVCQTPVACQQTPKSEKYNLRRARRAEGEYPVPGARPYCKALNAMEVEHSKNH